MVDADDRELSSAWYVPIGERDLRRFATAVQALGRGLGANWREVALAANETSTTVSALGMRAGAMVFLEPQDANARAVSPVISSKSSEEIVIGHSSSATPGVVGVMWRQ